MSLDQPLAELRSRLLAEALRKNQPTAHTTDAHAREAQLQAMIGVRLAGKRKHDAAIARFERAARLAPGWAPAHLHLGRAYGAVGRLEDAIIALRRATGLDPDLADAQLGLAELLELTGRGEEARAAYAEVVRLDAAAHVVRARLAAIEWRLGRFEAAATHYRAAVTAARSAGDPAAVLYEAQAELVAGRLGEAESRLREALAADGANAVAHLELGRVLVEAGRMDDAAASLDSAIRLDPRLTAAWALLANTRRFQATDRSRVARMEALLRRTDLSPAERQALHFALGKVNDDLGDYAVAMRHFDAANTLRRGRRAPDRQRLERLTSDLIARTSPGFLDPARGVEDATPILVVGMPRSGTTLVEQILSSHPEIAAGGELTFWRDAPFSGADVPIPAAAAERLAGDYLRLLRTISTDAARVVDKMPYNFWRLGLIGQLFPRATIVHCRRNPIDTCLSIYATDFAVAEDFASDRGDLAAYYRQYQRLMAHWRRVLPADQFIEVDYEAVVADPESAARRLVAATGLAWDDACLAPHLNHRRISTASLWQARQPIYSGSVGRWRRYEAWLGELGGLDADQVA